MLKALRVVQLVPLLLATGAFVLAGMIFWTFFGKTYCKYNGSAMRSGSSDKNKTIATILAQLAKATIICTIFGHFRSNDDMRLFLLGGIWVYQTASVLFCWIADGKHIYVTYILSAAAACEMTACALTYGIFVK